MDDGDRNGPCVAKADVEQREVNGSKRPWFDSLPVEPDITPFRASVPFWTIFGLVSFHGLVDGVSSTFGQFVGHPDFPNGFLFPPGHGFPTTAPVKNAPFSFEGKNHLST